MGQKDNYISNSGKQNERSTKCKKGKRAYCWYMNKAAAHQVDRMLTLDPTLEVKRNGQSYTP